MALLSKLVRLPDELRRKSYHLMCSLSIFILIMAYDHWYNAVAAIFSLYIAAMIIVRLAAKLPMFQALSIARKGRDIREVIGQIVYLQAIMVLLLAFFWGVLGAEYKYYPALGFICWGFGDAVAALIGRRFGRHKYRHPWFDRAKSLEGTLAMIGISTLPIFLTLLAVTTWAVGLLTAPILAIAGGVVEAMSKRGTDTVTVPLTVAVLSIPVTKAAAEFLNLF